MQSATYQCKLSMIVTVMFIYSIVAFFNLDFHCFADNLLTLFLPQLAKYIIYKKFYVYSIIAQHIVKLFTIKILCCE